MSAITAVDGISTMIPNSISLLTATPSATSFSFSSKNKALAALNSCTVAIIGNITHNFPYTDARNNALSCVLKRSFSSKQSLIALNPKNGFISFGKSK